MKGSSEAFKLPIGYGEMGSAPRLISLSSTSLQFIGEERAKQEPSPFRAGRRSETFLLFPKQRDTMSSPNGLTILDLLARACPTIILVLCLFLLYAL